MLTESERNWANLRQYYGNCSSDYCSYCQIIPPNMCALRIRPSFCKVLEADIKDAFEFEQKVTTKLIGFYAQQSSSIGKYVSPNACSDWCPASEYCDGDSGRIWKDEDYTKCRETILKAARLAVEEEMNAGI